MSANLKMTYVSSADLTIDYYPFITKTLQALTLSLCKINFGLSDTLKTLGTF